MAALSALRALKGMFGKSRLGKAAAHSFSNALPRNMGDALLDYGPDLGFAVLAASTLPQEYASGAERFGWAAEDAALGVGGSMLGRAAVTAAAMPFVGPRRARRLGGWIGGMGGGVAATMMGPRLYGGSLDRRAEERMQQAQNERDQMLLQQGMQMASRGGGGRLVDTGSYLVTGQDPYQQIALEALGMI